MRFLQSHTPELRRSATRSERAPDVAQPGTPKTGRASFPILSAVGFLVGASVLLGSLLFNGYRLEQQRIEQNTTRLTRYVRFGDVVDLSGLRLVSSTTSTPNIPAGMNPQAKPWTLLVFSKTSCHYCGSEFEALKRLPVSVASKVRVINIVQGQSVTESPQRAAAQYSASHRLPFDTAIDPDTSFGVSCGSQGMTPYSVLLDSQHRVRYTFSGYVPMQGARGASSALSEDLSAFITGRAASTSQLLWSWRHLRPLPNVPITTSSGVQTSLDKLSANQVVVVTSAVNDGPSRAKIESLRRFLQVPKMAFICVNLSNRSLSFTSTASTGSANFTQVQGDSARNLSKLLGIDKAPASAVVFRRRVVLAEQGPIEPGSHQVFNRFLSQIALFSEPVLRAAALPLGVNKDLQDGQKGLKSDEGN